MAAVYLHRKEYDNSIYYVGIGNSEKRAREIRGRSEYWTRVFNKYGRNIDIVANNIPLEDAKELEIFLIQQIGIDNLCNHTLGGEGFFGGKHTEETKRKISAKSKGRITTKETKAKIGKKLKGHQNYNLSHTDESKAKISAAFKGKKRSEYFCKQVKKSKIGYCPSRQAIENGVKKRKENASLIIELNSGFIGKIWEIENKFNIDRKAVYYNCKKEKAILTREWKGLNFKKYK
jgi:NUMOD3 motif